MIQLTDQPIASAAVIEAVRCPAAGAIVLFLGTVREMTDGRPTRSLDYECYAEMAETKLTQLAAEAGNRWSLAGCAIVHRVGQLTVGETAVAVAVSAAHRREAFDAAGWLMDRIKEIVPIWKKENYADGTSTWVHPPLK